MKFILIFLSSLGITYLAIGQSPSEDSLKIEPGYLPEIIKANFLSTHPLGMFISRINHNFKSRPGKASFSFELSNGNVWLPYVKAYILTDPVDQKRAEGIVWHERADAFDLEKSPSLTKTFFADGVLRSYRFAFSLPLTRYQEININVRSYSLDKGSYPLAFITSDQTIEWFHSNIAGGQDPFAREYYGLNQAGIFYKDENDHFLRMDEGEMIIPGIELNYFYYLPFNLNIRRNVYVNLGGHLGVNTSKYNPSSDLGLSGVILKKINLKKNNLITFGLSMGALYQKLVKFGEIVDISDRTFLYSWESHFEFKKYLRNSRYISYGLNYNLQSSYNQASDFDHIVLTGIRKSSHWHYAISHLYRDLQGWSLIAAFTKSQFSYYVYLREDLLVDNAPDIQSGLGFKFSLN